MSSSSRPPNTSDGDDGLEVATLADGSSRPNRRRPRWRVFRFLAVVVLAIVLTCLVLVLARDHQEPISTQRISTHPPPYVFVWQHPAPGNLTPQQAFDQEARVWHFDGATITESPPVGALWIAQTNDAALALALLGPGPRDREHLAVILLERTGGATGTWSGDWQMPPEGEPCSAASGYCMQIVEHTPTHQITGFGTVSDVGGASDIYVRFAEPLTSPAQGGLFDGARFATASRTPTDEPTASLVILGPNGQAEVDAAADWLAAQP